MSPAVIVAIDGPSGSGKSTVARLVAEKLNLPYIDTGAMYRALTLKAIREGIAPDNETALAELAAASDIAFERGVVRLDGDDVSEAIRDEAVTKSVSEVSTHRGVREVLVALQKSMLQDPGVVMEGRDIGTVVAPQATVKVYLTAEAVERAKRRSQEILEVPSGDVVLEDMRRRDARDFDREHSPLRAAPDAVVLDSTQMSAEEVAGKIIELLEGS